MSVSHHVISHLMCAFTLWDVFPAWNIALCCRASICPTKAHLDKIEKMYTFPARPCQCHLDIKIQVYSWLISKHVMSETHWLSINILFFFQTIKLLWQWRKISEFFYIFRHSQNIHAHVSQSPDSCVCDIFSLFYVVYIINICLNYWFTQIFMLTINCSSFNNSEILCAAG